MAIRRHDIRVYIEGVRIPAVSVSISAGANEPSSCTIQIPAVNELLDIPSRAYIQVFFLDFFDPDGSAERSKLPQSYAEGATGPIGVFRSPDLERYRLLWDGELRSKSLQRSPTGWSAQIYAEDLSNHWSTSYGIFEPGLSEGMNDLTILGSFGVESDNVEAIIIGSKTFSSDRQTILASLKDNKAKAVEKAVETYFTDTLKYTPFLRATNRRLKLAPFNDSKDVAANAEKGIKARKPYLDIRTRLRVLNDPEANILVQSNLMDEMFTLPLTSSPAYETIRQVVSQFCEVFFYQTWPVIAPPYFEAEDAPSPETEEDVEAKTPGSLEDSQRTYLTQLVMKPTTFFSAPPACNVIWPDDVQSLSYEHDTWSEPTRLKMATMPMSQGVGSGVTEKVLSTSYHAFAPRLLGKTIALTLAARRVKFEEDPSAPTANTGAAGQGAAKSLSIDPSQLSSVPKTKEEVAEAIRAALDQLGATTVLDDGDLESDLIARFLQTNATGYSLILSDPSLPPESREDFKGIVPTEIPLSNYVWSATFSGDEATRQADYIRRVADYYLFLKQHERSCSVQLGGWNPYILVGFPCVVLDDTYPIFGEVAAINHTITANNASTSITLNYARSGDAVRYVHPKDRTGGTGSALGEPGGVPKPEADFVKAPIPFASSDPVLSRPKPNRDVPFWMNASYWPEYVGETDFTTIGWSVDAKGQIDRDQNGNALLNNLVNRKGAYPELFGVKSLFQELPDPDDPTNTVPPGVKEVKTPEGYSTGQYVGMRYSQLKAAELLLKARNRIPNERARDAFMDGWRKRRVATMAETLKFVGARYINTDLLSNSFDEPSGREPYRDEVRKSVIKMAEAIQKQGQRGGGLGA